MNYFKLLIILTLISCSSSFEADDKGYQPGLVRIAIDGKSVPDTVDISDIIESIKIVKIQEAEDGLFGEIEKLILTKDKYVIFDRYSSNQILLFTTDGKFFKNLVKKGAGPEELTKLSDVWVNGSGELEVYDHYLNKIITYDSEFNVKEANIFKQNQQVGSIIRFPGETGFVAYSGYNGFVSSNEYYKLAILDSGLQADKHFLPYPRDLNRALIATPISPFFVYDDTIRFTQNFDPSVYAIAPDGKMTKAYDLVYSPNPFPIDFESKLVTPNLGLFTSELMDFEAVNKIFTGYTGYRGPWLETSKFAIFSSFDSDYATFTSIYDKDRKEMLYQAQNFAEDKRYHMQIPPYFYTTHVAENRFISSYQGYYLLMLLKEASPFYKMVQEDMESFYIIDVALK